MRFAPITSTTSSRFIGEFSLRMRIAARMLTAVRMNVCGLSLHFAHVIFARIVRCRLFVLVDITATTIYTLAAVYRGLYGGFKVYRTRRQLIDRLRFHGER